MALVMVVMVVSKRARALMRCPWRSSAHARLESTTSTLMPWHDSPKTKATVFSAIDMPKSGSAVDDVGALEAMKDNKDDGDDKRDGDDVDVNVSVDEGVDDRDDGHERALRKEDADLA